MYTILSLPKTEKEVKKLRSSSSTYLSFQEKMFFPMMARIDICTEQLWYIFPNIHLDYSLESLRAIDEAMNEYIDKHPKEYQPQDIYSCWIDWIQLPEDIKSIAFDIGIDEQVDSWIWMAWNKIHNHLYRFDSITWRYRTIQRLKEEYNPPYPVWSDKWIEYVVNESTVYEVTPYQFPLEISWYEVLFVNITIPNKEYYSLSPEGGLRSFFVYIKKWTNFIEIIEDETLSLYDCSATKKKFDRKKYELSQYNQKLRDTILKKIFWNYRELWEIPVELKEFLTYSPNIFQKLHPTYFRGFFIKDWEPDNTSIWHIWWLWMCKRGAFKKENGIQEDILIVGWDRAWESCFGRLLWTTQKGIRLFGVYDFDTYSMISTRGFSLDGIKYKRFSTLVHYNDFYFEDTGKCIADMKVYRAKENAYEKYQGFFIRYHIFYSDAFSFEDFLKKDIVLFVKTNIGLYIEIYNAEVPRKANGQKSREVHTKQRQQIINEIVERSQNSWFDIRDL